MNLDPGKFTEFFEAAHKYKPFPWQKRLLDRVTRGPEAVGNAGYGQMWPEAMALPTGSGKTSCIDIAIFALACQAGYAAHERTAPRRIIFVVDRRVIVDEAYEHAKALAARLLTADKGVLKDVADALRYINGDKDQPPLTCHQLRGGMYRDDAWARTPTQPCVIAATVDQIGSRLLFRSYGRSNKARPVHAGLAANDALILLDEAHCANPFMQTMKAIARFRDESWAQKPLGGSFSFTIMSATPPPGITDLFSLDMNEEGGDLRDCDVLRRRITASKPTLLIVAPKAKKDDFVPELAVELVAQAAALARDKRTRIVIFVNRVATARRVFLLFRSLRRGSADKPKTGSPEKLRKQLPDDFDEILLTGRMRPIDRDRLLENWVPANSPENFPKGLLTWFGTSLQRPTLPRPVFVVSTQCLEVGANLDFDGIVTECAGLDALRQRFGRVDRIGRADCPCPGVIVIRKDQTEAKTPDPVYGDAIAHTWQWLNEHAAGSASLRQVDFGIGAMHPLIAGLKEEKLRTLVSSAPDAPVMAPAHMDCWVQTAPGPRPDPDVSVFLHGVNHNAPEIQVCWRGDLEKKESGKMHEVTAQADETQFEENVRDAVSLCPPATAECVAVPLHVFRRWWKGDDQQDELYSEVPDLEASVQDKESAEPDEKRDAKALIWRGPEDSRLLDSITHLQNGDTVVIAGDHGWKLFGDPGIDRRGDNSAVSEDLPDMVDVGDICRLALRQKPLLRLHPALIEAWPKTGARAELIALLAALDDDTDYARVRALLKTMLDEKGLPDGLQETVRQLLKDRRAAWIKHPIDGLVILGRRTQLGAAGEKEAVTLGETFTTEDESSSFTAKVLLEDHCEGVANLAGSWSRCCGFPPEIVHSLRLAGKFHDLGKSDMRYQAFLQGRNVPGTVGIYAKSAGFNQDRPSQREAWRKSNLPEGFRHEQLSVSILDHVSELPDGVCDRELVLHLVACHHGRCRPLADTVLDETPPDINLVFPSGAATISGRQRSGWVPLHRLDGGVPERFWKLVRRYGWWGLAWLEAVFISADHRRSETESEQSVKHAAQPSKEAHT